MCCCSRYVFALLSCLLQASYLILVEQSGAEKEVSTTELLYYNALLSLPLLIVVSNSLLTGVPSTLFSSHAGSLSTTFSMSPRCESHWMLRAAWGVAGRLGNWRSSSDRPCYDDCSDADGCHPFGCPLPCVQFLRDTAELEHVLLHDVQFCTDDHHCWGVKGILLYKKHDFLSVAQALFKAKLVGVRFDLTTNQNPCNMNGVDSHHGCRGQWLYSWDSFCLGVLNSTP